MYTQYIKWEKNIKTKQPGNQFVSILVLEGGQDLVKVLEMFVKAF